GSNSGIVGNLTSLTNQLPILGGLLNGVLGGAGTGSLGSLTGALQGLGVNLGNTLVANYNVPGVPNAPTAASSVIATPAGAPLQLNLAPYQGDVVTNQLAQAAGIAGARASADNSTTSLAVTPSLSLPNLGNILGSRGLLAGLGGLPGSVPVAGGVLGGITGRSSCGSVIGLLGNDGGLLSGILGNAGLLGGLTNLSGLLGGLLGPNGLLGG